MATHELKTWPRSFEGLLSGAKSAELRKNDRGFQVEDVLSLREWDPLRESYTGRAMDFLVSDIESDPRLGVPPGYVLMSVVPAGYRVLRVEAESSFLFVLYSGPSAATFQTAQHNGSQGGGLHPGQLDALARWLDRKAARIYHASEEQQRQQSRALEEMLASGIIRSRPN